MTQKSFSYGDVLSFGWDVMKNNFGFFVGVLVVLFAISFLGEISQQLIEHLPAMISPFLVIAFFLVISVLNIILAIGLIKIALSFCDDIKPKFSLLFNGLDCFWRYIGAALLYSLIMLGAFAACILPFGLFAYFTETHPSPCLILPVFGGASILMVVLSIKFSLCFYFVIDKGLGPINAIKASSRTTAGAKLSLFVFGIVCGLINLLGVLCFFIGLLATTPTIIVAMALVYRQLSAQTPELAELGIDTPAAKKAQLNSVIQTGLSIRLSEEGNPGADATASPPPDSAGATPINPPNNADAAANPPNNSDAAANPPNSTDAAEGTQSDADIATNLSIRLSEVPPSASGIQPVGTQPVGIQPQEEKGKLWWISFIMVGIGILIVLVAIAIGLGFRFRNEKKVPFIPPQLALNGILYSEDSPSAIVGNKIVKEGDTVNGAKVIKINKDTVEFEKDGRTWTQKLK